MTTFILTFCLLGFISGALPPARKVTAIQQFELPIYFLVLELLLGVIGAKFGGSALLFPVIALAGAAACALGVALRHALRRFAPSRSDHDQA